MIPRTTPVVFLLQDLLADTARRMPERLAVADEGERLSYRDLDIRSDRLAAAIQSWGAQRGDRVVLMIGNTIVAAAAIWATLRAGCVIVPVSSETRPTRLRTIMNDCGAAMVMAPPEAEAVLAAAMEGVRPPTRVVWTTPPKGRENDPSISGSFATVSEPLEQLKVIDQDLAAIIYTSGTTADPKGVMLTHRNLTNTTAAIASYLRQEPDDIVCSVLPLAFSYGLFQLLTAARVGSAVVLEQSFAFPYDVLRRIQTFRATMFPAVPTIFAKILQILPSPGVDLGSLRCLTNAAAAIPPAHVRRLRDLLPAAAFYAMYGQTECTRATYLDPALVDDFPDSVGRAIPNCEAYLVDECGRRLAPGSEGELVIRGSNVMRGYWGRPEETAQKLRDGPLPGEKVLMTGDQFRTNSLGLLRFVARKDDIFKCRGEKVSPSLIEHVLCELAEVAEAAVVGIEDPNDGTAIKAFVVARAGISLSESRVRQHCRASLEPSLVPRFIVLADSLPKTESGKLRRADLRTSPQS